MDDTIADATPKSTRVDPPTGDAALEFAASHLHSEVTAPIVVDLGRRRAKQIKKLRQGKGPLISEINDVIAQVRSALAADLDGKTLVPLVVVYKQKKRKRVRPAPTAALP
jgi:hypothetical protein